MTTAKFLCRQICAASLALLVACEQGPTATEQQAPFEPTPIYGVWTGVNAVAELELRVNPTVPTNLCNGILPFPGVDSLYEITGTYRDVSSGKSVALCTFAERAKYGRVGFWLALDSITVRPTATLQYVRTQFAGRIVDANTMDAVLSTIFNRDNGGGSWSPWTADSSAITLRRQ